MSLIPKATLTAAEIEKLNAQTISFLQSQARRAYGLVTTPGEEQAVLDALGTQATQAVQIYGTLYAVLDTLGKAEGLIAPDPTVFVANNDGTVTYVAPPKEPEEEV